MSLAPPVAEARVTARYTVDPADPVFAGHYPGFPVLPGLYLLDYLVEAVRPVAEMRVDTVQRCRFLGPVYPGDEIDIDATLTLLDDGPGRRWRCTARVVTGYGRAADLRLILAEEVAG